MDNLKTRLREDMKKHLKAGNRVELMTVRNLLGEINTREKGGKTPMVMDDAAVTSLLQKEAARRRETAQTYTEVGAQDRAAAENAEAEIIEAYLPAPLDEAAVSGIIDGAIATLREEGTELSMRSMGQVMKLVSAEVAGRFDGKKVSEMVRSSLG